MAARANDLAFYTSFDRLDLVNRETDRYRALTVAEVNRMIRAYFQPQWLSEVEYLVEEG